jgi:hypothetical protein
VRSMITGMSRLCVQRLRKGWACLADSDDRTNSKMRKAEESASRKLIKELAKKCPGCKWNIEKNDGCDHMTCKGPSPSLVMCIRKALSLY